MTSLANQTIAKINKDTTDIFELFEALEDGQYFTYQKNEDSICCFKSAIDGSMINESPKGWVIISE